MLKVGKISSIEGDKYRVYFEDLNKTVTLPLSYIKDMTKIELTPGEQSLTYEQEKFKINDNVLVGFTAEHLQSGVIIGKI